MLEPSSHFAVKRLRIALGTFVAIEAVHATATGAGQAVAAAFEAIAVVDGRLHPRPGGSDLARINGAPVGARIDIHPSTTELLRFAIQLHEMSRGMFDPCTPMRAGRLQDVEVAATSVVCHRPVFLDFGGFGKGHAVDRAIEVLESHGCSAGLVNAGGDVRVFGDHAEPIFLRHPFGGPRRVALSDAAIAVSDTLSDQRPAEHSGYYCHTGPQTPVASYAAVRADSAMTADALTKCVLLCPEAISERLLNEFKAELIARI